MKKRKHPLRGIEIDGVLHECSNAAVWPPAECEVYEASAEELRYSVPDLVYQRLKTWEQVCGLFAMSEEKCVTCPYVKVGGQRQRAVGVAVTNPIRNARTIKMLFNKKQ